MSDPDRPRPEQSSSPDLATLDAGWGDEDEDDDEDPEEDENLEALDGGWDSPERKKSAAERAARKKARMQRKAEKRKARSNENAQKQKQKKPRKPDDASPRAEVASDRASTADDDEPSAPIAERPAREPLHARARKSPKADAPSSLRRDWVRMGLIVGVIVVLAAAALYFFGVRGRGG